MKQNIIGKRYPEKPVDTPCVKICMIDENTDLCRGCLRTVDEITNWGKYTRDKRLMVYLEIEKRRNESRTGGL